LIPDRQKLIINGIQNILTSESRVKAIFLSGSLGRDEGDKLSDIDSYVVVEDDFVNDLFKRLPQITSEIEPPMFSLRIKHTKHSAVFVFSDLSELSITILSVSEIHPSPVYENIKPLMDDDGLVKDLMTKSKGLPSKARIETLLRIESLFLWGTLAVRKRILRNNIWDARDAVEKLRYLIVQLIDLRGGTLLGYKDIEKRLDSIELLKLSKTAFAYDKDALLSALSMCFDMFEGIRDELFKSYSLKPDTTSTEKIKKSLKDFR